MQSFIITIVASSSLYLKKFIKKLKTVQTDWHNYRNFHNLAFKEIIAFVAEEVIQQKKLFFKDL